MIEPIYALSIKQPWAALLVAGLKTIEVRRWSTKHRGPILIHAASVPDLRIQAWRWVPDVLRPLAALGGGIIGRADLVACHRYRTRDDFLIDSERHLNDPDWFREPGLYGFEFRAAVKLPFRKWHGSVRFFRVPVEAEA